MAAMLFIFIAAASVFYGLFCAWQGNHAGAHPAYAFVMRLLAVLCGCVSVYAAQDALVALGVR